MLSHYEPACRLVAAPSLHCAAASSQVLLLQGTPVKNVTNCPNLSKLGFRTRLRAFLLATPDCQGSWPSCGPGTSSEEPCKNPPGELKFPGIMHVGSTSRGDTRSQHRHVKHVQKGGHMLTSDRSLMGLLVRVESSRSTQ